MLKRLIVDATGYMRNTSRGIEKRELLQTRYRDLLCSLVDQEVGYALPHTRFRSIDCLVSFFSHQVAKWICQLLRGTTNEKLNGSGERGTEFWR